MATFVVFETTVCWQTAPRKVQHTLVTCSSLVTVSTRVQAGRCVFTRRRKGWQPALQGFEVAPPAATNRYHGRLESISNPTPNCWQIGAAFKVRCALARMC
jgi:hypothetical protein